MFRCRSLLLSLTASLALTGWAGAAWRLSLANDGRLALLSGSTTVATVELAAFNHAWTPTHARLQTTQADTLTCDLLIAGSGSVACTLKLTPATGGGLRFDVVFEAQSDAEMSGLFVSFDAPAALLAGQSALFGEAALTIPATFDGQTVRLWSGRAASARLPLAGLAPLELTAAAPMSLLCQDNRKWGETLSLRVQADLPPGGKLIRGQTRTLSFVLQPAQTVEVKLPMPVTISAGSTWIPLQPALDIVAGSALDWSTVIPHHAPAGSRGWLQADRDGHFVFEQDPKTPVRFYGINFCFDAQYLSHDEADRIADRLLRLGYNAVRIHHYERELVGTNTDAQITFRADQLDKLDYLFAALRKRGLYVTTDLYVSRPVKRCEIWPGASNTVDGTEFRLLLHVNEQARASWFAFARLLLEHRNPYTGLRYVDDPALCLISLVNEGNLPNYLSRLPESLKPQFQAEWNRFLAARYVTPAALATAWGADPGGNPAQGTVPLWPEAFSDKPQAADAARFCAQLEARLYERLSSFVRKDLKSRALLTNLNGWNNPRAFQGVRAAFDYVDDHLYVGHPSWVGKPWSPPSRCDAPAPTLPAGIGGLANAFVRIPGKPFTLTEFNYAAPGHFRGAGGLVSGALAALQDWEGIWRFAYSHRRAGELEPSPISYFDLCRDPLNQAADRAMLTLFLRQDAQVAPHGIAVDLSAGGDTNSCRGGRVSPNWNAMSLVTRIGTTTVAPPAGAGWITTPATGGAFDVGRAGVVMSDLLTQHGIAASNLFNTHAGTYAAETGELRVSRDEGACTVNTPCTAGGFRPAAGEIGAGTVHIRIEDGPATVWLTSLDGKPIGASRHLLVTHLTDLQQEGTRFGEESMQTMMAWGTGRPLVHAGRATIDLPVPGGDVRAWGLAVSGARSGACAATRSGARVSLPLDVQGPDGARMMYEIEVANGQR